MKQLYIFHRGEALPPAVVLIQKHRGAWLADAWIGASFRCDGADFLVEGGQRLVSVWGLSSLAETAARVEEHLENFYRDAAFAEALGAGTGTLTWETAR